MRFALVTFSAAGLVVLASCSDAALQTPDGAFYVKLTSPGGQCMITGNTAQVGSVDAQNRNIVINDGMGMGGASGVGGTTKVTCTVSGTSSFNVHGTIDDTAGKTGDYFEMQINNLTPGASEASPAAGTGIFSASWTAGEPYSGPCNFWFTPSTSETVNATGGVGRVWVTFSCPALTSGMSTCPLSTSYAIFENCLTDATM